MPHLEVLITKALTITTGALLLLFAVPELIAQLTKVVIRLGPVTYGPEPKVQLGKYILYFKGTYWYLFITSLTVLIIIGTTLIIWGTANLLIK